MARHKSRPVEEQGEPEMEISSMIDCCFLLLIYFLVATSLVSEKKLDVNIPGNPSAGGTPPPVEPGRIDVSANGAITWNGDMPVGEPYDASAQPGTAAYKAQRHLDQLVEALKTLKEQAVAVDTEPIVMVTGAPSTPHQRIVDVMAALAEADIHTVGLNTTASE
ncbi:MAG: biopolymer transporter ExbD [Akkermansia sp.]|nr:biopolymer transporter ExbD [Akkermansia sp.]